jgi:hypothetical protein
VIRIGSPVFINRGSGEMSHLGEGFLGGIAMEWNDMSVAQKILYVAGCICVLSFFALRILTAKGILVNTDAVSDACFCVWSLSNTLKHSRIIKVLWYVMAALAFYCFLTEVFGW